MADCGRHDPSAQPIIGLTGGIGSGKSTVARILADLGAGVISSDELNRSELESVQVKDQIRDWWGPEVFNPAGRVDRSAVRQLITGDATARQRLESLLHPRIEKRRLELTDRYRADPRIRAIVWDSPLLYEAGLDAQCDAIIFVDADDEVRRHRVQSDRGWSPDQLERLEKTQKPLDFKRKSADHRVVNNSDRDALRRQVEDVFSRILSGD